MCAQGADKQTPEARWDVYVSYSHRDQQYARRLTRLLEARGYRVFFDEASLNPGDEWDQAIRRAMDGSSSAVVLISELERSRSQQAELKYLLALQARRDYRVVPVLLHAIDPSALPYELRNLQFLDATQFSAQLSAVEVADRLARILPRLARGVWERVREFFAPTGEPATSSVSADEGLMAVARQFFEAAGRRVEPGTAGPDLLVPEPVVCRDRPTSSDVDRVVSALPQGGVGYLVHRNILAPEVELRLDHARLHGAPVVPFPEQILAAAVADGNARSVLDALTADARASQNLFRTRNSVIDRRFLFGRTAILSKIGAALRAGEHILLSGSRKSGKTSVLNILRQDLGDHPVLSFDLQLVDRRDPGWPARLFTDVLAAYDRWATVRFDGNWPTDGRTAEDGVAFRDLLAVRRQWHAERAPIAPMLLLLDELERLMPLAGEADVASHFVRATGALRAVGQGNDRWLSIIAADLRPSANRTNQLPGGITSPLFQFFQELPLPLLDRLAIAEMVRTLARMMGGLSVADAVIDRVHRLSGGHPWIARSLAGAAWEKRAAADTLGEADLDHGLDELYDDDALGHFFKTNFWADLTTPEQAALTGVALGRAADIPRDIGASLRRQGLLVDGAIPIAAFAEWIVDQQRGALAEPLG